MQMRSFTKMLLGTALALSWSYTGPLNPWVTTAAAARVDADRPELAGSYACEGINPDGDPYRTILEVAETGRTWHLRWSFPGGDAVILGVGLRQNGHLVVATTADGSLGVVAYTATEGKLEGQWTLAGLPEVYAEHCVKIEAGAPNHEPGRPTSQGLRP
ncbi:MAG: hypothetical protein HY657_04460 [Acidobacteria bacterium]|nr:hypothetical protein [Acidobacteriota bacterium]